MAAGGGVVAMCDQTASTTRPAGDGSGMVAHLSGVKCTNALPVSPDMVLRYALESARTGWLLFSYPHRHTDDSVAVDQLPDILAGDVVTVGGSEYDVVSAAPWSGLGNEIVMVRLEKVAP